MKYINLILTICLTISMVSCNDNNPNEIQPPASINQISKNVVLPGEEITITGTQLDSDIIIEFNNIIIEPVSVGKTEITIKLPLDAYSGDLKISYNENSCKKFIKILDKGWNKIETNKSFSKIYFLENNIAYASIESDNGCHLYKSTDEGNNWVEILKSNEIKSHFLFTIASNDVIYAQESNRLFKKSIDGGNTWSNLNILSTGYQFFDIYFVNENEGYLTASKYNSITSNVEYFIMKTLDGGHSWNISIVYDSQEKLFNSKFIYNKGNHIYLYNKRTELITFTDNGGGTWIQKKLEMNMPLLGKTLSIQDKNNIWLGGNGTQSFNIFKIDDQKENFIYINKIPLINNENIVSFKIIDEQKIYATSNKGANYYTTNGGDTWKTFYLDKEVQMNNVFFNKNMVLVFSNGYLYKKELSF
ncbi:protein of unknown function [Tenacibaculum sp. 190524A02b]|uniref:Photosynthesis system II assembly factor Ycf48/Hcf136-like domain-containing protein n=1 Tax=Tenacibaculum vairaonense TaxID=3137860 RepID=A0ABM9PRD3_9FLAO